MVGVKVWGRRPRTFRVTRKIIREASIRAQLWPPWFRGIRIWCVNRLMNQLWRINRRL